MGLKTSLDIAQSTIEQIVKGLDVKTYIDDIGIFSNDYNEHMEMVAKVLKRLEDHGCKVNLLKCEWGVQETDFLGHWLTPTGNKPWKKKIDAVLKISAPKTVAHS
jgi:hypothetical protein